MSMQNPLSQVDQAFADTLIHKAEGDAFDQLAQMYGVPRIPSIPVKYWRKALQHVALGPRGAHGSTFGFVREALRGHDVVFSVQRDSGATTKHRIYWVSGGPAAGFTRKDLHRFWEIDGAVYLSTSWKGAEPGAPWAYIELTPYAGYAWRACDWSHTTNIVPGFPVTITARRLAFTYRAYGARYKLYIEGVQFSAPPTYMQDAYGWQVLYANAAPAAGSTWFPTRDDKIGAWEGLAVPSTGLLPVSAVVQPAMCSWQARESLTLTRFDVEADADDSAPARGGGYTVTLQVNGVDTALSVTLGAADTAGFSVGAVAVTLGDSLAVKVTAGGGVTQPLKHLAAQTRGNRPGGQPLGGALLPDAAAKGDQVDGPFPLYLIDDALADWTATLDVLVAAGVIPEAHSWTFENPW